MPTVTITWDDINDNEDGFNIYRSTTPLDIANPANLPAPLATVAAGIGTYDDTTAAADTTYYYAVAATKGSFVNPAVDVEVITAAPSLDTAAIGDEIGGGVYAGTITYSDTRQFHIIFAKQAGESAEGPKWGNYGTTTGATDPDDGLANQNLILTSFDNGDSEPFYHCRDYVDGDGNADYYLPASNELALEANIRGHAEMSTDTGAYRWSSTEDSVNGALNRRFSDGYEFDTSKLDTGRRVRPVRRVAV